MKKDHPFLFEEISWSSRSVLTETLKKAAAAGLTVSQLPILADIDDVEALVDGAEVLGEKAPQMPRFL